MSEQLREHPLTDFMRKEGRARVIAPCVEVTVEPFLAHVNVRGNPDDPLFQQAVQAVLGHDVPAPGSVRRGDHAMYWLGPREFLIVTDRLTGRELVHALTAAFDGGHAAATDLSGGQILLTVRGPATRSFLSKASTLDLHESAFGVDDCAQSTFAKAAALYALRSAEPVFELVIRRSFADYAARWMLHAGQEFGIVFRE